MKIAAATEDGKTISQHFGRAPHFAIIEIQDGRVVGRELREKASHGPGPHVHQPGGEGNLHGRMAAAIPDCEVVLAGGMGTPSYESLQKAGIRPIITEIASIDEAVRVYLAGGLSAARSITLG